MASLWPILMSFVQNNMRLLKSEVAIVSLFRQIKQPDIFLLEVKRITKSRGNEIAEYVKSSNLHQ